jgi:hypothetical protein
MITSTTKAKPSIIRVIGAARNCGFGPMNPATSASVPRPTKRMRLPNAAGTMTLMASDGNER